MNQPADTNLFTAGVVTQAIRFRQKMALITLVRRPVYVVVTATLWELAKRIELVRYQ
jgi:hypothetical protein